MEQLLQHSMSYADITAQAKMQLLSLSFSCNLPNTIHKYPPVWRVDSIQPLESGLDTRLVKSQLPKDLQCPHQRMPVLPLTSTKLHFSWHSLENISTSLSSTMAHTELFSVTREMQAGGAMCHLPIVLLLSRLQRITPFTLRFLFKWTNPVKAVTLKFDRMAFDAKSGGISPHSYDSSQGVVMSFWFPSKKADNLILLWQMESVMSRGALFFSFRMRGRIQFGHIQTRFGGEEPVSIGR